MDLLKTTKLFYIIYSIYTFYILLVSDYNFVIALVGLVSIWLVYIFFTLGFKSCKSNDGLILEDEKYNCNEEQYDYFFSNIGNWSKLTYIFVMIICWFFAILAAKYYTGRGFSTVIKSLFGAGNAYNEYQKYFASSGLSSFTIAKIPYILMLTFILIILYWGSVSLILLNNRISTIQIIFIVSVCLSQLYFGTARGTNFETYTVFILISYCILNRRNTNPRKNRRAIAVVGVLGIIMVFVYRAVIMARGVTFNNSICPEIRFNNDSFLADTLPALTGIVVSVFSYLGYGIYEIGVTHFNIILDKLTYTFASIVPGGVKAVSGNSLPVLLGKTINMGARWCPDYVYFISALGIPLFYLMILAVGRFANKIEDSGYPDLLINVIRVIIFIELLSIPVGNFLSASTPTELFVVFTLFWYIKCRLRIRLSLRR